MFAKIHLTSFVAAYDLQFSFMCHWQFLLAFLAWKTIHMKPFSLSSEPSLMYHASQEAKVKELPFTFTSVSISESVFSIFDLSSHHVGNARCFYLRDYSKTF